MTSPPRKNGATSCRSGDIISIRHTSSARGRRVWCTAIAEVCRRVKRLRVKSGSLPFSGRPANAVLLAPRFSVDLSHQAPADLGGVAGVLDLARQIGPPLLGRLKVWGTEPLVPNR